MVCELKIRQMEKMLGRKLTEREKKKIREKMGHIEIEDNEYDEEEKEELEVVA